MDKTKAFFKRLCSLNCISWMIILCILCLISPECWAQTAPAAPRSTTSVEAKPPAKGTVKTPAEKELDVGFENFRRPSLITQAAVLSLLALLPFVVMILSSFMKIVVVLSLLRSALGVQQSPPNQVINGVAFMLSIYVMYPTGLKMYDAATTVVNQKAGQSRLLLPVPRPIFWPLSKLHANLCAIF